MGCFSSKSAKTGREFEEELIATRRAPPSNTVVPGASPERGRQAQTYLERAADAEDNGASGPAETAQIQGGSSRYIAQPRTVVVGAMQQDAGRQLIFANTSETAAGRSGHSVGPERQQQLPRQHHSTLMEEFDADDPTLEVPAEPSAARASGPTIITQPVKLHIGGMPWSSDTTGSNAFAHGPIVLPDTATAVDDESDDDEVTFSWRARAKNAAAKGPVASQASSKQRADAPDEDDFDFEEPVSSGGAAPAAQRQAAAALARAAEREADSSCLRSLEDHVREQYALQQGMDVSMSMHMREAERQHTPPRWQAASADVLIVA